MNALAAELGLSGADLLRYQAANAQGIKAVEAGNPGGAIAFYEEALRIKPEPHVYSNLGDALARAGRFDDAVAAFERAIEMDPEYDQPHYNLGVVYDQRGDYAASRAHYLEALRRRVTAAALNNVANAEVRLLKPREAERHYRAAIKQGFNDARWNLSLCHMMLGKWEEAWDNYEFRPQMAEMYNRVTRWRGEDLKGKTLLVVSEQGLGDSVYVLRYVPLLRKMGASLVLVVDEPLKRLVEAMLADSEPELPPVQVIAKGAPVNVGFHFETLAMSIPGYVTPDGCGPSAPYLKARGVRLPEGGFNVGLCWNGSTVVGHPAERNIPLKLLRPLADIEGVRLVSLQKGGGVDEIEECGFELHDAMGGVRDLYDTACVISSLDLVISVDTLIPHLAGALGKPVWLMNRYASCWQWGVPDYDPHLYSTVQIFRQHARGDWSQVVAQVAYGLARVAETIQRARGDA